MAEHGFPAKPIRLIRATLDGSKSSVRIADKVSTSFESRETHFRIYCSTLHSRVLFGNLACREITLLSQALGFADDIDLIGIDRRSMEEAFVPLKRETSRIGLTKEKYMVAGRDRVRLGGVGAEVVFDGDVFESVEEFVYLETLVTCDNDVSREVKRRVAAANRAFYGLRNQLRSRSFQTVTKFALYKTLILSRREGHEAWTLKESDRKAIGVFERKVL